MGKRRAGKQSVESAPSATPFNNPFAALQSARERLPPGDPPPPAPGPAAPAGPARAVVRLERKGRGGKEVTVVEQLGLGPAELERWLKDLKQALGCGGAVEGQALAIQGDHRDRVRRLLEERGVRRVSVG
jgi:translation initiation factor 1